MGWGGVGIQTGEVFIVLMATKIFKGDPRVPQAEEEKKNRPLIYYGAILGRKIAGGGGGGGKEKKKKKKEKKNIVSHLCS